MTQPTRPELSGNFGMASATHWLAAGTAMAMLDRGGNAFDAAVAGGLVLQVVEPHLNGPGGDVPIIFYQSSTSQVKVICGQGPLPARANIDDLVDSGLTQVPGTGVLPMCVPGAFGAWMMLLEEYGSLDLETVMAPAIAYAQDGFRLLDRAAMTIDANRELFLNHWKSSAEVYLLASGATPKGGGIWKNSLLANTYSRILDESKRTSTKRESQIARAREIFYSGFVAEAIDSFVANNEVMDDSGDRHRGYLSGEDMARWSPSLEDPISINYQGYEVFKTGPWGQGPVFLQQLRLLEGFDISAMDPRSADFVHLVIEAAKLSFADRDAYYGDPNYVEVPLETLLSKQYADSRRKLISKEASLELRPGSIDGKTPWYPSNQLIGVGVLQGGTGAPPDPISKDTCQIDVVDRYGNMVSATPSGGWLHGGPCIPGLGFSLSTRGQMFWLDPDSPTSYVGGRRPRTTLSPTIALGGSKGDLAFGTPGGDQQDQWTLSFFLRKVHFNMNLQEAIDAPTFHTSHFPSSFYPREAHTRRVDVEARFGTEQIDRLREMGHDVHVAEGWGLGRVCAVGRVGQELIAGSDPRQDQAYSTGH
ncbi:MAG: gamma-glutamyltransferase family protein [Actinomycetota bacterium]|nr:gamma-glutamyltransferase family protein [Actinomycetota bacterium]